MSPIEQHLVTALAQELRELGLEAAHITVLSAEAENWRYRIEVNGRSFEIGFNHREQLWTRETTPGAERHLVSNDAPRIPVSSAARKHGLRLVQQAVMNPAAIKRDPPVI